MDHLNLEEGAMERKGDTPTSWTSDFILCVVQFWHVLAFLDAIGDHEARPIFGAVKAIYISELASHCETGFAYLILPSLQR